MAYGRKIRRKKGSSQNLTHKHIANTCLLLDRKKETFESDLCYVNLFRKYK